MKEAVKRKITSEESNACLQHIFNNFLILNLNSVICGHSPEPLADLDNSQVIKSLGTVEGVAKTLRTLKLKDKKQEKKAFVPAISN